MHKHLCLNCGAIVAEDEFDCELDTDHDYELCERCIADGVTADALNA